jgi:hypothetical protein
VSLSTGTNHWDSVEEEENEYCKFPMGLVMFSNENEKKADFMPHFGKPLQLQPSIPRLIGRSLVLIALAMIINRLYRLMRVNILF